MARPSVVHFLHERRLRGRRMEDLTTKLSRVETAEYEIKSGAGSLVGRVPGIKTSEQANEVLRQLTGRRAMG